MLHFKRDVQLQPFAYRTAAAGHYGMDHSETTAVLSVLVQPHSFPLISHSSVSPSDVGKSSLLLRFADNSFSGESLFPNTPTYPISHSVIWVDHDVEPSETE